MPEEPPTVERFENGEFFEIAVDGKVVARLAERPDITTSPADDAVLLAILRSMVDGGIADFQDEHGKDVEEVISDAGVNVEIYDGEEGEWESIDLP